MQHRLVWVDLAKSVGIILVVVGHAGRGLSGANLPDENGLLLIMDQAIYAFHMPLFFLLSGVTFGMRPPASFQPDLTKRVWRIMYSLVIWTYVFLALRALAGDSINIAGSWKNILVLPLPPFSHFWFLWALLLNMTVFALLRLFWSPATSSLWFWCGALAVTIAANIVIELPSDLVPWFLHALHYSPIFVVGCIIGASSFIRTVPSRSVTIAGFSLFALGLWVILSVDLALPEIFSGLILSLLLILPLMTFSAHYGHLSWYQSIAFLGVISLAIYVMHTIFSACIRILLFKAGIEDLAIHLVLGIMAGILGPLFAYLFARKFGLLRIAGLA